MNIAKVEFYKKLTFARQYFSATVYRVYTVIRYKKHFTNLLRSPLGTDQTIIYAINHPNKLDPAMLLTVPNVKFLPSILPIRYMVAAKFFTLLYTPALKFFGSFPHKGSGLTGVEASVYYARQGYRIVIFPEGRVNRVSEPTHAYEGIVRILEQLPEARLVLVNIQWEKRTKFFSRPLLSVTFSDPPDDLDQTDAMEIMRAIYASAPRIEKH